MSLLKITSGDSCEEMTPTEADPIQVTITDPISPTSATVTGDETEGIPTKPEQPEEAQSTPPTEQQTRSLQKEDPKNKSPKTLARRAQFEKGIDYKETDAIKKVKHNE
nr:hypothetical protein [Tanacetum cinerariifolium]